MEGSAMRNLLLAGLCVGLTCLALAYGAEGNVVVVKETALNGNETYSITSEEEYRAKLTEYRLYNTAMKKVYGWLRSEWTSKQSELRRQHNEKYNRNTHNNRNTRYERYRTEPFSLDMPDGKKIQAFGVYPADRRAAAQERLTALQSRPTLSGGRKSGLKRPSSSSTKEKPSVSPEEWLSRLDAETSQLVAGVTSTVELSKKIREYEASRRESHSTKSGGTTRTIKRLGQ
jgi:hypothetical protein